MKEQFLAHYQQELEHLREKAAEFARQHPKIAARLLLDAEGKNPCNDPFVERLLEGVAFLNARIQVKFDAEFPRLTQALLETVYPHFLAPTPSMLMARFEPMDGDPGLAAGFPIPRGTALRSEPVRGLDTACEFRTAHEVTLWPLRLAGAGYLTRELSQLHLPAKYKPASALRLQFKTTANVALKALQLDRLAIHLRGSGEVPYRLYEDIFARCTAAIVLPGGVRTPRTPEHVAEALQPVEVRPVGFGPEEALLPVGSRSFDGYRLLAEYFRFPQRFLFFEIGGLRAAMKTWDGDAFDVVLLFDEVDQRLENTVDRTTFDLFCTPAINLFEKRLDRVQITDRFPEYHVVPDGRRPLDYEVHTLTRVEGVGETQDDIQPFTPFYFSYDRDLTAQAFYTIRRTTRALTERERLIAARSGGENTDYLGSETYVSLVDANHAPLDEQGHAPFRPDLQQLSLSALCTNRHLPLSLRGELGKGGTDFHLEINAPVSATRCISPPTAPVRSVTEGDFSWRVISHLALNYLSLTDGSEKEEKEEDSRDEEEGDEVRTTALREILALYADRGDDVMRRQLQGLRRVSARRAFRRVVTPGPIGFARGYVVTLRFSEPEFTGVGLFLFGAVLERFLAKYVSINSFAETVLRAERGEIMRWRAQPGLRPVL